jgi:hypothetical protein
MLTSRIWLVGSLVLGLAITAFACVSDTATPGGGTDNDGGATETGPGGCQKGEESCNGTCQDVDNPTFGCDPLVCTKACGLPNVDKHSCSDGSCRVTKCLPNKFDCNGDPKDGCESLSPCKAEDCAGTICSGNCVKDLQTDPANCGSCGKQCGLATCVNGTCMEGGCTIVGAPFFISDNKMCGTDACHWKECPADTECINAICTPCAGGMTRPVNANTCVPNCDPLSRVNNRCGASCQDCTLTPGEACIAGKCDLCPTGQKSALPEKEGCVQGCAGLKGVCTGTSDCCGTAECGALGCCLRATEAASNATECCSGIWDAGTQKCK